MYIRANDTVEVIAGADRGLHGKVLRVLAGRGKVVVEGAARVYKHMRRSQTNPRGGRLSKEMPIAISNVMVVCPACGKPTRVGVRRREDGAKFRVCKRSSCKKDIGQITAPRKDREHAAAR